MHTHNKQTLFPTYHTVPPLSHKPNHTTSFPFHDTPSPSLLRHAPRDPLQMNHWGRGRGVRYGGFDRPVVTGRDFGY
ncbi:hypothetical protein Pmani_012159 [Petrolisthes manimaculis]|uniref:Uncharacterized protein n=1 Tax=Petrolisthes manimaculis TaxID=1843537 RepID=A0AAE1UAJ0_9EUCA|nr:hypothetical protein Pmani_012159 [Petrolisthes manimaculis]